MTMADRYAVLLVFSLLWRGALTGNNSSGSGSESGSGSSLGTLFQKSPLVSDCRVNGRDPQTAQLWGVIRTPGACAQECGLRPWCNSFHYKALEKDCFLCSLHYLDSDVLLDNGRTKYFRASTSHCFLQDGFVWDRSSSLCVLVISEQNLRVSKWDDAVEGCRNQSLRLVSLNTTGRLDFVTRLLRYNDRFQNVNFFIGASRPKAAWGQAWPAAGVPDLQWLAEGSAAAAAVDIKGVHAQYWAPGQPDNAGDSDNVVMIRAADGFLLFDGKDNIGGSYSSASTLGYVCEK